ncbi:MAG: radical SAM protein [Ruminiclostridium sp.]
MSSDLVRYSLIDTHMKREFLLLQGKGCIWGKCTFCDYYTDVSSDPFEVNKPVIDRITGVYGVVDVINSGSVFELDQKTMAYLRDKLKEKSVHTLWCESHWLYRNRLEEIRRFFEGITVKFRIGAETFDPEMRKAWKKGIAERVTAEEMGKYFDGACLLVCVKGQTKEQIIRDIELAKANFEYFNVNVFVENSTLHKTDFQLAKWFAEEIAPTLEQYENIEVLLNNTDLGVG